MTSPELGECFRIPIEVTVTEKIILYCETFHKDKAAAVAWGHRVAEEMRTGDAASADLGNFELSEAVTEIQARCLTHGINHRPDIDTTKPYVPHHGERVVRLVTKDWFR